MSAMLRAASRCSTAAAILIAAVASGPGLPLAAQSSAPSPRAHHALVYDAAEKRVVLIGGSAPVDGGRSYRFFDDVWAFDGTAWVSRGASGFPRSGQAVVYDPKRRQVVSFGGYCGCSQENSGRYPDLLALAGNRWSTLSTMADRPTTDAGMVYDTKRDRFVLFGGAGRGRSMYSDTWEYDGRTWVRTDTVGPGARGGFAMVYDEARNVTVLFSGFGATGLGADTWEYNGTAWRRVATEGPSGRHSAGMTYDTKRHLVVLFGGMSERDMLGDTWSWDGRTWRKLADGGPPARGMGFLAYDAARDRVVMFGGRSTVDHEDTWEWDGARWSQVATPR